MSTVLNTPCAMHKVLKQYSNVSNLYEKYFIFSAKIWLGIISAKINNNGFFPSETKAGGGT